MPRDASAGDAASAPARGGHTGAGGPSPRAGGFDITPPAPVRSRPAGLSGRQKGYLALGMLAVLGAAALAADILAARQGSPPTRGLEQLAEELGDVGPPGDPPPVPGDDEALGDAGEQTGTDGGDGTGAQPASSGSQSSTSSSGTG